MVFVRDDDEVLGRLQIGAHRGPERLVWLERPASVLLVRAQQRLHSEHEHLETVRVGQRRSNLAPFDRVQGDDHWP